MLYVHRLRNRLLGLTHCLSNSGVTRNVALPHVGRGLVGLFVLLVLLGSAGCVDPGFGVCETGCTDFGETGGY